MGQSKRSTAQFLLANPWCIFCGGSTPATTREHCPPRALFIGKAWPEGFEFPACAACNGGTSDKDLLVAFLAHIDPDPTSTKGPSPTWLGLMKNVRQQVPGFLQDMRIESSTKARQAARRVGVKPLPGQTYRDLPFFNVPPLLADAVKTFAGKLTRATFFMETGEVFPRDGGILFHWFTNGSKVDENGMPIALATFAPLASSQPKLTRSGQDLSDQFAVRVSLGTEDGDRIFLLQAAFRRTFGFVCIASTRPGQAEGMLVEAAATTGGGAGPFVLLPAMP